MKRRTCAFTGHRPQKFPWRKNEADERCVSLKAVLDEQIKKMVDSGYTDFLSGMACGVDTWAAQTVLALRKENPALKLHCILPCKTQTDAWSLSERERYCAILKEADSIVWVERANTKGCMLKRNHYLVDHSEALLAIYNGERRSGTAATVNYARKAGREIYILDPATLAVSHEDSDHSGPTL